LIVSTAGLQPGRGRTLRTNLPVKSSGSPRLVPGAEGGWRIADIVYPETPELRLSTFLTDLLRPQH